MRFFRFPSTPWLWVLALLATAPVVAQRSHQASDGTVRIVDTEGGPRVHDVRGSSTPLVLPDDVVVEDLAALGTGWLLAGHEPRGVETELYLKRLDAGGLRSYPTPARVAGRERSSPVVLTRDGQLDGLVWLEGDDRERCAVMASRWLGITWSPPIVVSAADRGPQLALTATVLDDGSWLLAWAGWDGEDDEIWTSVVTQNSATTPRPLTDNAVPDVLPTVMTIPEGALLAWNTFDGDGYRVATARRLEGRWEEATALEARTYFPHLVRSGQVVDLLYFARTPGDAAWVVAEIDAEGRVARRGRVASPDNRRPTIFRDAGRVEVTLPADGTTHRLAWESER